MRIYSQTITGGQTWKFQAAGRYFRIMSASAAIGFQLRQGARLVAEGEGMVAGFGLRAGEFNDVLITTATTQTITVAVAEIDVDFTPVTLNTVPTQATGITDAAPVSVGTSATVLLAADSTRKGVRFYNAGTADVYLGSSSITTANGAVRIAPGATWIETDAAPAAWYGISGTAAQSVRMQTVA